jgi:hypothetical protein
MEGGEAHPQPPVDLGRQRNALARALTPEYMGLNPNDFMDVTPEMVKYAAPAELSKHLIDVPFDVRKSPRAVAFYDPTQRRERNIAVTPKEAQVLPRFMNALQQSTEITADAKITTGIPTEADIARVKRSPLHAQEAKLPKVRALENMLVSQHDLLSRFIQASEGSKRGLSMFGPEVAVREKLAYLQTFIIGDMIRAYGSQRQLSAHDMKMLDKAITVRLFFGPDRLDKFHDLAVFLGSYNEHKYEATKQRREAMERNIARLTLQA